MYKEPNRAQLEAEMEEAQMKKRNKYLDFLCAFSGLNPIPT